MSYHGLSGIFGCDAGQFEDHTNQWWAECLPVKTVTPWVTDAAKRCQKLSSNPIDINTLDQSCNQLHAAGWASSAEFFAANPPLAPGASYCTEHASVQPGGGCACDAGYKIDAQGLCQKEGTPGTPGPISPTPRPGPGAVFVPPTQDTGPNYLLWGLVAAAFVGGYLYLKKN